MALDVESAHRVNLSQGLLNLTQGLNSLLTPKLAPTLSRTQSNSARNLSAADGTSTLAAITSSTESRPNHKIPRKWNGFSKEQQASHTQGQASPTLPSANLTPNAMSPPQSPPNPLARQESMSPSRRTAWPRRKESIPDILMNAMTTVHEYPMDSPTIPGHPPTQSSTRASPVCLTQQLPNLTAVGSLTPPPVTSPIERQLKEATREKLYDDPEAKKKPRRKHSQTLPRNLAPLLIPSNDKSSLPAKAYRPSEAHDDDGPPPKVPPKSPRTLNKAFPQSSKLFSSSVNSSTVTFHTTGSSATSISTPAESASRTPRSAPIKADSRATHSLGFGEPLDGALTAPRSAKEVRTKPSRNLRGGRSVDETSTTMHATRVRSEKDPAWAVMGHQRWASEASVMNRGRPTKKGEAEALRGLQLQHAKNACVTDEVSDELSQGICSTQALDVIPMEELRMLRKQAKSLAKGFKLLRETQLSILSQELVLLDERCAYLQKTYVSLREGRKGLQQKVIDFLRSPMTTAFSTGDILRQEDAMAELDVSIDEWIVQLELAQDRRNTIRRKLLEHSAAVLLLRLPGNSRVQISDDAHTPPRSPTKVDRSFSTERRDVESIKVYADSGVASLLASIELELGLMEQQGRFEP